MYLLTNVNSSVPIRIDTFETYKAYNKIWVKRFLHATQMSTADVWFISACFTLCTISFVIQIINDVQFHFMYMYLINWQTYTATLKTIGTETREDKAIFIGKNKSTWQYLCNIHTYVCMYNTWK